ncbi:MAG: flavodoxin domain-containing protein [Verrucomicrobiota bacterium]
MKVYYATMTGNAESLASTLVKKTEDMSLDAELVNLDDVLTEDLKEVQTAVFIVSTWGEGEPPDDAEPFWEDLEFSKSRLENLRYSVFGLGDSGYAEFNGFAKVLDARLQAMGAVPVIPRVDADIDYDDDFDSWEASVFSVFSQQDSKSFEGAV